MYCETCCG